MSHPNPPLFSPATLCTLGPIIGSYAGLHFDKEACRTSPLSGREYIAELLTSNERRIHEVLCMPKTTFLDLGNWLVLNGGLGESRKKSVDQQLAMFLAIVGHRCTNCEVQERFQVCGFTVTK